MKRIPSNRMPKYVEPKCRWWNYFLLALVFAMPAYIIWSVPWYVSLGIIAAVIASLRIKHFSQKRVAAERVGESICTFARSFNFRSVDTWIIRAVYEAIEPEVNFPLRKTDNFCRDMKLDWIDVSEIAEEVAQRTGRPLTNSEQNPWYGKVETVADMVEFFMCQPKQAKAIS
jgi:hypothetical protein